MTTEDAEESQKYPIVFFRVVRVVRVFRGSNDIPVCDSPNLLAFLNLLDDKHPLPLVRARAQLSGDRNRLRSQRWFELKGIHGLRTDDRNHPTVSQHYRE